MSKETEIADASVLMNSQGGDIHTIVLTSRLCDIPANESTLYGFYFRNEDGTVVGQSMSSRFCLYTGGFI